MTRMIGARLLQTLITLLVLVTATFWLLHVLPGGPFDTDTALAPEVKAKLEQRYHLDQPILKQYLIYMKSLGSGDFGSSLTYIDENVSDIIAGTLPVTIKLGFFALIFSYAAGIAGGLLAARFHRRWLENAIMFFAVGGVSMPSFLLAPLLILVFSFWLDWFPPALWEGPQYYILPVLTLSFRHAAMIARMVRASALDVIQSDFVRTAEAKGLPQWKVLWKHVLKNSLIPLLGISGTIVASILSGSFIVEVLFAIPGLGRHLVESVFNRDYPLILSLTLLYGVILCLTTLVLDLLSMAVDPRMEIS
jgi:oligopeptide transport system permease protein